jgi:cob(I)alamin adenosyltransferase
LRDCGKVQGEEGAMKPTSRILLFTGDGKGKTTAAIGMAVRAAGHGMPVLVVQFIKADDSTGELAALRKLGGVDVRQVGRGFVPKPESPDFAEHREAAVRGLDEARKAIVSGQYRVVVLDEICTAVAKGLAPEVAVTEAVRAAPEGSVIVLTGRGASAGLIELADTVTEMRCLKHGHQKGLKALQGVEF